MSLLVLSSSCITPAPPLVCISSSSSSSSSSSLALSFSANPASRLNNKFTSLKSKVSNGFQTQTLFMFKERGSLIVKASANIDGTGSDAAPEAPSSESKEETEKIENLPLESKLQLKLEQKARMKLAKKMRLRRKRLVRKRHLRKKGRWPPSKMKKNKNV